MAFHQLIGQLRSSNLFKSFSVYVFSSFFNQGVSFLLIPVFTKYLTPGEYGILSLVNTTVSLLTIFIMVGADGSIRRQFYKLKGEAYARFFSSALLTSFVAFFIISALASLASIGLSGLIEIPRKWIFLAPIIAFTSILPTILLGQYRVQQRAGAFAVFSNSMTVLNLVLAIVFVVVLKLNYEGRLYSTLIVNSAFFILAFVFLKRQDFIGNKINWEYSKTSLKYGLPIIPHQIGAFVIAFSDRYFIANMVNVDEVGIYNVGYQVGSIIGILEGTFGYAFTPFLFESLTENSVLRKKKVVKVSYLFILFLALAVLLLTVLSFPLFKLFIDERFHGGQIFVLWVAIGFFFSGCYKMVTGYIYYSNKTIFLAYLSVFNIVVNILLNYLLISRFGALGAAYASCFSYFAMFALTAIIAYKLVPMPWFAFKS